MASSPVPARSDHRVALTSVLTAAFFEEETTTWIFPDPIERLELMPVVMSVLVKLAMRCGRVFVVGDPVVCGGSLWYGPDGLEPDDQVLIECGYLNVEEMVGVDVARRFHNTFDYMDVFRARHAPKEHWNLALLGVDPKHQRQGIGKALMQPVFDIAAATNLPCVLETASPGNVPWYRQHGFEVTAEEDYPNSNLHFWLMQRNPG